jgi:hypothetical protein
MEVVTCSRVEIVICDHAYKCDSATCSYRKPSGGQIIENVNCSHIHRPVSLLPLAILDKKNPNYLFRSAKNGL